MDPEAREILRALLEGQRVAEAERKVDRALLMEMNAKLDEHSAKLNEHSAELAGLRTQLAGLNEQISELSARDRYFIQKLGEHDMEIAVLKQQRKVT